MKGETTIRLSNSDRFVRIIFSLSVSHCSIFLGYVDLCILAHKMDVDLLLDKKKKKKKRKNLRRARALKINWCMHELRPRSLDLFFNGFLRTDLDIID